MIPISRGLRRQAPQAGVLAQSLRGLPSSSPAVATAAGWRAFSAATADGRLSARSIVAAAATATHVPRLHSSLRPDQLRHAPFSSSRGFLTSARLFKDAQRQQDPAGKAQEARQDGGDVKEDTATNGNKEAKTGGESAQGEQQQGEEGGKKDDDKKDDKKDDKEEKAPPSVPGGGAGGNKETENQKTDSGDSGNGGNGGNSGNSDSGSDNSAGDASSAGGSANCPIGEFGVDCDGNGNGNGNGDSSSSKSSASLLAIVIAGCALYWL
jgi:uncharacterized membrane protein YgcG